MADLRAVVQYLGERVLGEKFDIDDFEVPPEVLAKISQPSEEIASVRLDIADVLARVATEMQDIGSRVAAIEKAPAILPPALYDAARRAVEARMATVVPEAVTSELDQAAIAELADRIDGMERAIANRPSALVPTDMMDRLEAVEGMHVAVLEMAASISTVHAAMGALIDRMRQRLHEHDQRLDKFKGPLMDLQNQVRVVIEVAGEQAA